MVYSPAMAQITLEQVARFPRPGTAIPGKISFSPDLRRVTFLHSSQGNLTRELWQLDLATGQRSILFDGRDGVTDENVSREEALRRERQRLRETGVTHYAWARAADVLIVPIRGSVTVIRNGKRARVAEGAIDPHVSRDGTRLGYVRDGWLHVTDLETGGDRKLAEGGLAEYVAQEEMHRQTGFWFSHDGRRVAFEQYDEKHIPVYPIVHQGKDQVEIEEHRYPFAGARNAFVRLGVVSVDGGPVAWTEIGEDRYLARVAWSAEGRLFVQIQSRDQRRLELQADGKTLLVEESPAWVNLHDDLRFFDGGKFVWSSERTGHKHLYLYGPDGGLIRALTSGAWAVDAVVGTTPQHVYFTAGKEGPLEKHLYRVPVAGGEIERLTREPGMHDAVVARDGSCFVDIHDSRASAPSVTVRRMDGSAMHRIHEPAAADLPAPEIVSFRSRDGETLYAAVYKPAKLPAPCIVEVYGGPHVQMVNDSWLLTVDLRAQYLAQQGYLVARIDNRGAARRGHAFEAALREKMGTVEVRDQVDGVRHLASLGWIDPARVGVYGWSYGGYLSLLCLATAGDVFRAAVSGAPVTHWDGYDTHYTERYMRTPQANPEGYRNGSVMEQAAKIRGALMLIHGMLDENVHFRHTARLVKVLDRQRIPYELMLLPDERHMPRKEEDRVIMEEKIARFFERALRG